MASYNHKNQYALAFDANKKRLRTEGGIILARVMNEALNEMTERFNEGELRGEVLEIGGSQEELRELLFLASQKAIGPGDAQE